MNERSELRFTQAAQQVLARAEQHSLARGVEYIGSSDITLAIAEDPVITGLIEKQGQTVDEIRERITFIDGRDNKTALSPNPYPPRSARIFKAAWTEAQADGTHEVTPLHILKGAIHDGDYQDDGGVGFRALMDVLGPQGLERLMQTTPATELAYKLRIVLGNPALPVSDRESLHHSIDALLDAYIDRSQTNIPGYQSLVESFSFQGLRTPTPGVG